MDASYIIYTGIATTTVPITPGQNLQLILQNIDAAINAHNTAPNYSGYNLGPYHGYSITQTDGTTHPTNTQNFAEGIAKIVCTDEYNLYTFINTTYPTDQGVFTTAITNLQSPALTYVPFSITSADTINTVYTKMFTGFTGYNIALNPSGANWSSLSISPPVTVTAGFNSLISYLVTLASVVNSKQATIAPFNNTSNCLSGGAADTIRTTVASLITYACALPTFDYTAITFGGVTAATDLQDTIQNSIDAISYLLTNGVIAHGTGLSISSVGSTYQGKKLSIDTTYTQLYKLMVTGDAYTDANVLDQKVKSSDGSLSFAVSGNKLDITVTDPVDTNKVKVNSSDTTAGYLALKMQGAVDPGGLGLGISVSVPSTNDIVTVTPTIDPSSFFGQMMTYISQDPTLFAQFTQLVNQIPTATCTAPADLVVVIDTGNFALTWTPSGSADTQNVKWRVKGSSTWITMSGVTPANPQMSGDSTATVDGTLLTNTLTEFVIDSNCTGGGIGTSNVYEMIQYVDTSASFTNTVVAGVISVNQDPLPSIDTVQYRLKDSGGTVLFNVTALGASPANSFTAVGPDTYSVEYRFVTLVNGVFLNSDDPSQLGAYIVIPGIVVP